MAASFFALRGFADDGFLYSLTDLGTLGGTASRAAAINERGWVAGESETESGAVMAFLWTPENGMRNLGTLGGPNSRALDINNDGVVVGESSATDGITRAFIWTEEEGMKPAPSTTQTLFSTSFAINNQGQVVGSLEEPSASHAVMWNHDAITFLPRLPGPGYVQPLDVNDSGDVVGQLQTGSDETLMSHAFYFREALTAHNLSEFNLISPKSGSAAVAINNHGEAVGYVMSESAYIHAFRFARASEPQLLPDRESLYSSALDLNDEGAIVGSCIPAYAADEAACLWINGQFFNLNEVSDTKSDWWLIQATGINDSGMITGYGLRGNDNHAFLLKQSPGMRHEDWPVLGITVDDRSESNDTDRVLLLKISATDHAEIRRAQFFVNGNLLGSVDKPPFEWEWECARDQQYEFYAEVTDQEGRRIRSPRITVEGESANAE